MLIRTSWVLRSGGQGAYYDEAKQAVCFTLLDLGVGILKSVRLLDRVRFLSGQKPGEKLEMLLCGNVPSRTGEKYRGRGLPKMKETCDAGRIRNLMVLTNNACAHVERDDYLELKAEFRGTIIYWEVAHETPKEDNG